MNLRIARKIVNKLCLYQSRKGCYALTVKASRLCNKRTRKFLKVKHKLKNNE